MKHDGGGVEFEPMTGERTPTFEYGLRHRIRILVLAAIIGLLSVDLGISSGPPGEIRTVSYWVGNMSLLALFYGLPCWVMFRRRVRHCRRIKLNDSGVTFGRGSKYERAIRWDELQRVEVLPLRQMPRYGGVFGRGWTGADGRHRSGAGLRLVAEDCEIPVLVAIRGYNRLRSLLEARARALGIPFDAPA